MKECCSSSFFIVLKCLQRSRLHSRRSCLHRRLGNQTRNNWKLVGRWHWQISFGLPPAPVYRGKVQLVKGLKVPSFMELSLLAKVCLRQCWRPSRCLPLWWSSCSSQQRRLYEVYPTPSRPNSHHNRKGTSETTHHLSHLSSNLFPDSILPFRFSFIVFPIVCSTKTVSMDIWLRFFYCPFAAATTPLANSWHSSHFSQIWRCPSRIWASVSGALVSNLISPFTPPHLTRGPGVISPLP